LYKEDFEKFSLGLKDAVEYIDNVKDMLIQSAPVPDSEPVSDKPEFAAGEFTNVDFDDLGKR